MGQNATGEGEGSPEEPEQDLELSFYSDDSYEYVPWSQEVADISSFKNKYRLVIPSLAF